MNAQTESYEEEYEEYDEFDDEDDGERGLSGLVVLIMGVVMLAAFASVVWIAYQQGMRAADAGRGAPYVAADPDPVRIENEPSQTASTNDRAVYDRFEGEETAPVETLAEGPEEPVARTSDDPIAAIASANEAGGEVVDDAVADRIASLAEADDEALGEETTQPSQAPQRAEPAAARPSVPAATSPSQTQPAASQPAAASGGALAGTHLVQVGAFGSQAEADQSWSRLQTRLGDYVSGKSHDVERADLGERGVFFRLRIGPFASSDAARTFCEGLKSRGQDCLVRAK